jgi:PIF1-like helicase
VVLQANGSVKSIFDWAVKAQLDRHQRRAFEVILGHFILTFITQAIHETDDCSPGNRRQFNMHKKHIFKLLEKDRKHSSQTIGLLYGPGGSGKTTVINLILEYAKEYCLFLEGVDFNSRTIVVSAMTGVAATMLRGETTHAAVYLNQKAQVTADQIEVWTNTRLLIGDEISFAGKGIFIELNKKLRKLKSKPDCAYGGLSVIFSGDFRQLEPVGEGQQPIYKAPCPQFTDWVDCYLELEGMHRFKNDPEWGQLLKRFRNGDATSNDIRTINSKVVLT